MSFEKHRTATRGGLNSRVSAWVHGLELLTPLLPTLQRCTIIELARFENMLLKRMPNILRTAPSRSKCWICDREDQRPQFWSGCEFTHKNSRKKNCKGGRVTVPSFSLQLQRGRIAICIPEVVLKLRASRTVSDSFRCVKISRKGPLRRPLRCPSVHAYVLLSLCSA